LNPGGGLGYICMLFTKEDRVVTEVQTLDSDHVDELDYDFAVQEVNRFLLSVKSSK
jgi:hypothetical protein